MSQKFEAVFRVLLNIFKFGTRILLISTRGSRSEKEREEVCCQVTSCCSNFLATTLELIIC
jgi:hypothetical protein